MTFEIIGFFFFFCSLELATCKGGRADFYFCIFTQINSSQCTIKALVFFFGGGVWPLVCICTTLCYKQRLQLGTKSHNRPSFHMSAWWLRGPVTLLQRLLKFSLIHSKIKLSSHFILSFLILQLLV